MSTETKKRLEKLILLPFQYRCERSLLEAVPRYQSNYYGYRENFVQAAQLLGFKVSKLAVELGADPEDTPEYFFALEDTSEENLPELPYIKFEKATEEIEYWQLRISIAELSLADEEIWSQFVEILDFLARETEPVIENN